MSAKDRIVTPRKALNKAFLKIKPVRSEIEAFKSNLIGLLDHINEAESEEYHKNLVTEFLKKTYYHPNHFINTYQRTDLVIHNDKKADSTVGVLIETKKPTNVSGMISIENLDAKAFQEILLYYFRQRITLNNLEIKHIIITNINEWFIFDAQHFEKLFADDKRMVKKFRDFEAGRLSGNTTEFFYRDIAKPALSKVMDQLEFTHFDFRAYDKIVRDDDRKNDKKLIALYKLLSPQHLLKQPFANDSNTLDKKFYSELLHIIGLKETKKKGKKIIERHPEGERMSGTLLENAIIQLDSLDKISRLKNKSQYGDSKDERLFNVALELVITWINRILFLKLLESQLVTYHNGNQDFAFLNLKTVPEYDDLNKLFFQVLAKNHEERNNDVKHRFEKVPYLNSSLFDPTDLEHQCLFMSQLEDGKEMPIIRQTVMKDKASKKMVGSTNALEYLYRFLDAYDFSSEGSEDIQEDNKTLINASVLGLIFEKINGYKDGSFFTPGFITMYMCCETIRRAVVQKFNDAK